MLQVVLSLALVGLAAFLSLRDPGVPAGGLDPSWVIATERAAQAGAAFGRDYIFTYGPYAHLSTRLFDPSTHGSVIFYDLLLVLMLAAPALITRAVWPLSALLAIVAFNGPGGDPAIMAAFLAVFLAALLRRNWFTLLLTAACAPLVLSKLSYLLVLAPLLVLADARYLLRRRFPVFTPVLLAGCIGALLAAGQKLADAPAFAVTSLDIILGYGRAMQSEGPVFVTIAALLLSAAVLVWALGMTFAPREIRLQDEDRLRDVAALLGLCWFLFIAFKGGFVRQDAHVALTFDALALGVATYGGYLGRRGVFSSRHWGLGFAALALAIVGAGYVLKSHALRGDPNQGRKAAAVARLEATAAEFPQRIDIATQWASGGRWDELVERRASALESLRRTFPPTVKGSVDVIPFELAEVIASGLDYRGRPVIQSYSSYTARLQRLDREHLSGPNAPDTLFFKLLDIDKRLPSLATGPSLPVIGRRYDMVGTDRLGLILRKRDVPRAMTVQPLGGGPLPLNSWTPVPRGALVMAEVKLPSRLAGKAAGFLFREPVMRMHLRTADGKVHAYRFVAGMAESGVAISPLPVEGDVTVLPLLDPAWRARAKVVTAMKIEAPEWAFSPGAVRFTSVSLAPGFGASVGADAHMLADLLESEPQALHEGSEIFAHAPLTLSAPTPVAMRVAGRFGLRPHPPGPPDDGVRFVVASVDAAGRETLLTQQTILPGGAEGWFSVVAPAGGRLILRTETLGSPNFDWSYWKDLRFTPLP